MDAPPESAWQRFLFAQSRVPERLARARCAVGAFVAVLAACGPFGDFFADQRWLYDPPVWLEWLPPFGRTALFGLRVAVTLSALLVCVGLWTRASCVVAALSFFTLNGLTAHYTPRLFNYDTHLNFFLIALACVDCGGVFSLDSVRRPRPAALGSEALSPEARARGSYVLAFMLAYIALLYWQAVLAKLVLGGFDWFWHGEVVLLHALRSGTALGRWLTGYPDVFPAMSMAAGLFELVAPLGILRGGRSGRWAALAALSFHTGVWLVLGISFWHLSLLIPVLLIYESTDAATEGHRRRAEEPVTGVALGDSI